MLTRRQLLTTSLAALTASACRPTSQSSYELPGQLLGAPAALGHQLREDKLPEPSMQRSARVVIAGAGISGLSVAHALRHAGIEDVLMLDMLDAPGGNSSYGRNAISAYPWGAHYVPLVSPDCEPMLALFSELGIIKDIDTNHLPIYNEYYLSADPQERLWLHGRWQDGLVPSVGVTERDRQQYAKFFALTDQLKNGRGRDGKLIFSIPVDDSSTDPEYRQLDQIDMRSYLLQQGFDSVPLHWYVNYCCRDDYGCTSAHTSAWAGLHYFAARNGVAANADPSSVVTWPEGNGYLVEELRRRSNVKFEGGVLVTHIQQSGAGGTLDYFEPKLQRSVRVTADCIVVCLPRFIAKRLISNQTNVFDSFTYAPWLVANLTVDKLPAGKGQLLAWDNVIYDSQMLGYVNATHQRLEQARHDTVLTYYWPLSHADPKQARTEALQRSIADWQTSVMTELLRVHPELIGHVQHMDAWVWGHAMIRPTPGFIWGEERQASLQQHPPIFFAHSDMSGISIFEEAYCRGLQVASQVNQYLAQPHVHIH